MKHRREKIATNPSLKPFQLANGWLTTTFLDIPKGYGLRNVRHICVYFDGNGSPLCAKCATYSLHDKDAKLRTSHGVYKMRKDCDHICASCDVAISSTVAINWED